MSLSCYEKMPNFVILIDTQIINLWMFSYTSFRKNREKRSQFFEWACWTLHQIAYEENLLLRNYFANERKQK